jgi:phosphodiesterase/alkaline phosphatase D-like protein
MTRRDFLAATAVSALPAAGGSIRHLLPTASHHRIRLKASFYEPQTQPPRLRAGALTATGIATDSAGYFWAFDLSPLAPATSYTLELTTSSGKSLGSPWTLRTLPHPDEAISRFRLLVYTCAGGHDASRQSGTVLDYWVPTAIRRRLFVRALSYKPDAVIANGDHIYWDLRFGRGQIELPQNPHGDFNRDLPVLGTPNELRLRFAVDPQIADLYGTLLGSVPVFFLQDDHDYWENDEAHDGGISFPPDDFMLRLARVTRRLYFPEFLPAPGRPLGLPGTSGGLSEAFGTLRWGRLAEILLYDCRRFLTLTGPFAGFIPETAEAWIVRRLGSGEVEHVVNLPSTPLGWSAGKWGEWYPDRLLEDGRIGISKPKYFWQEGWKAQHDRLLQATARHSPIPLFVSGDLHALAHGVIHAAGKLDFRRNPVHSVLSGPISTGPKAWPSSARGTPPQIPAGLDVTEDLRPLEMNGFTLIDFEPGRIHFRMFRWKLGLSPDTIDTLQPFHEFTLKPRA